MTKSILSLLAIFAFVSGAKAGVVCKNDPPAFTGETQAFLQKIAKLQKSQKLGVCDVKISIQDICDEGTQSFLYRGIMLTIGTGANPHALFGFDHFDAITLNFSRDGKMMIDPQVEKITLSANQMSADYHEAGYSDFMTRVTMSSDEITDWDFVATDDQNEVYEHLVCSQIK